MRDRTHSSLSWGVGVHLEVEVEEEIFFEEEFRSSHIIVENEDNMPYIVQIQHRWGSYCKALDHTIKEFPQLIAKFKSKANGNKK